VVSHSTDEEKSDKILEICAGKQLAFLSDMPALKNKI
jgi:hypothetical protein